MEQWAPDLVGHTDQSVRPDKVDSLAQPHVFGNNAAVSLCALPCHLCCLLDTYCLDTIARCNVSD